MERTLEINGKPRNLLKLPFREFKKKPIIITAVRIMKSFKVQTLEGIMKGKAGDWLVKGIRGEFYPVDYEIFMETYEQVIKHGQVFG